MIFRIMAGGLLLVLIVVALPVEADPRIRFRRFGIEQGLANETIGALLQDHLGYMWVGTGDGLHRFDGYDFEEFRHDPERPGSLPHNDIYSLLEDHRGRLWIGLRDGLVSMDREQRTFKVLPLPGTSERDVVIHALLEDRQRTLWIATSQGIFRLPLTSEEPRPEDVRAGFDGLVAGNPTLPDSRVYDLAESPDGSLWVGTRAGLFRLSAKRQRYRLDHFRYDPNDETSLHDNEVYAVYCDSRGELWIGAWGGDGLARLKADQLLAEKPRFQRFKYPEGDRRSLGATVVKSILEDAQGTLWIGTQLNGVRLLSLEERQVEEPRFQRITHDPLDPLSLPTSGIGELVRDDQGGIWVGTYNGGIGYHAPATAAVALLRTVPEPGDPPSATNRSTTLETRDGTVWSGTRAGVDRLRPNADGFFDIQRFRHDPADPRSLSSNRVESIIEDRRGRIWLGSVRGGLDRFEDGPQPGFVRYGKEQGLKNSTVFTVFEDGSGVLWVGTYEGLYRLSETPDGEPSFIGYRHQAEDPGTLSSDVIYHVVEDDGGRLWIGTDDGLDRLDTDRQTLVREPVLPGFVAVQMAKGSNGKIWAASESHGLLEFDPESNEWRTWGRREGLRGDWAQSVCVDLLGQVWVTSANRLHRLNPDTGEIRVFTARDGFPIFPFLIGSFHRGPGGRFYLGGNHGLAIFNPNDLHQDPLVAPVVLTGLQLGYQPVEVHNNGVLKRSLETLDLLDLPADQRTLTLNFAALVFHRQDMVRYSYRLRGLSEEWVETDSRQRQATFTDLSPGTYDFEVRARSAVGDWGAETAQLEIRVAGYWYESRALQTVAFLSLVGLVAWFARRRFRRLEASRQELQDLVDQWHLERQQRRRWQELTVATTGLTERTRVPLSKIRHLVEQLLDRKDLDAASIAQVDRIRQQVEQVDSQLEEVLSRIEETEKTPLQGIQRDSSASR